MKRSRESDGGTETKRVRGTQSSDEDNADIVNESRSGNAGTSNADAPVNVEQPKSAEHKVPKASKAPEEESNIDSASVSAAEPEVDGPKSDKTNKELASTKKDSKHPDSHSSAEAAHQRPEPSSEPKQETEKSNLPEAKLESKPTKDEGLGDSKATSKQEATKPAAPSTTNSEPAKSSEVISSSEPASSSKSGNTSESPKPAGFASFSASKPTGFSSFTSGFGGFSSSSKFGSTAKAPKSNPWAEPGRKDSSADGNKEEKRQESPEAPVDTENASKSPVETDAYAQVKLEKQELKTGEENETTLFQMRIRLYAMDLTDVDQKAWKERGTGVLKLNKAEHADKHRLLMRADGVLRVSLNLPLVQNMQVTKGFATSLHSEKFVKVAGIEAGKAHQFALRCATEDQRDELYDAIVGALPK